MLTLYIFFVRITLAADEKHILDGIENVAQIVLPRCDPEENEEGITAKEEVPLLLHAAGAKEVGAQHKESGAGVGIGKMGADELEPIAVDKDDDAQRDSKEHGGLGGDGEHIALGGSGLLLAGNEPAEDAVDEKGREDEEIEDELPVVVLLKGGEAVHHGGDQREDVAHLQRHGV